jgi:hypothetical protein
MNTERKFLEQLAKQKGGVLLVDDVIEVAKNPTCILHKHFQWDNTKAAEAYRKMQARTLIQKCTVTISKQPEVPIRAFVSFNADQISGGGYRMMVDVLDDTDLKEQLIAEMEVTLVKWKQRINLLDKETAAIVNALEAAITKKTKHKDERVAA